jgi:hypothetical protein
MRQDDPRRGRRGTRPVAATARGRQHQRPRSRQSAGSLRTGANRPRAERRRRRLGAGALTRLLGLWAADADYRIAQKLPELPAEEVGLDHLESLGREPTARPRAAHEEAQAVSHALAMAKNYRWLGATSVGRRVERCSRGIHRGRAERRRRASHLRPEAGRHRAARRVSFAPPWPARRRCRRRAVRGSRLAAKSGRRHASVVERYAKVVVPLRQRVVALTQSSTTPCSSACTSFSRPSRTRSPRTASSSRRSATTGSHEPTSNERAGAVVPVAISTLGHLRTKSGASRHDHPPTFSREPACSRADWGCSVRARRRPQPPEIRCRVPHREDRTRPSSRRTARPCRGS